MSNREIKQPLMGTRRDNPALIERNRAMLARWEIIQNYAELGREYRMTTESARLAVIRAREQRAKEQRLAALLETHGRQTRDDLPGILPDSEFSGGETPEALQPALRNLCAAVAGISRLVSIHQAAFGESVRRSLRMQALLAENIQAEKKAEAEWRRRLGWGNPTAAGKRDGHQPVGFDKNPPAP